MLLSILILTTGDSSYAKDVVAFVRQHCAECHSGNKSKGDFQINLPDSESKAVEFKLQWDKVAKALRTGEMPPDGKKRPSADSSNRINQWIDEKALGVRCDGKPSPGRVVLRRLNREEYGNAIRDLLGIGFRAGEDLPADDVGDGFDNQADVLSLSPLHLEKYLASAESAVMQALKGPSRRGAGAKLEIPTRQDQLKPSIERFLRKAWRRPPEAAEIAKLAEISDASGSKPDETFSAALIAALVSPRFLFIVEADPTAGSLDRRLDGYEVATRLSLFLWSSVPDEALLDAAASGKLDTSEGIRSQTERMMKDPKAKAFARNFTGQWLQLRNLKNIQPDSSRFPGITESLKEDMAVECEMFFSNLLEENRPIIEFIDSKHTFVNDRLAKFYGFSQSKVRNAGFRKHEFSDEKRGGVTAMAGVLLVTSNPTRTSPVKRGKFILENILGTPPPPPPPGVLELKDDPGSRKAASLRQRMEEHRRDPNCAVCHEKMDSLGFGLENFDAVGQWRAFDDGKAIDSAGLLPGGKKFSNPSELRKILIENPEVFADCLTRKVMTYALGRSLVAKDRCEVDRIVADLKKKRWGFADLVVFVTMSEPFIRRGRAEKPGANP
ncbi:MAG: DUF1592 domain-containing protein [Planctomycetes bacterium]|nr:DUF1592 domain-containing protein [Planctomycetota bacterium]